MKAMENIDIGRRKLVNLHDAPHYFAGMQRAGSVFVHMTESLIEPAAALGVLVALAAAYGERDAVAYVILSVLVFALSFPGKSLLGRNGREILRDVVLGWAGLAGLLLAFGLATDLLGRFPRELVVHWLWLTPVAQVAGHLAFRRAALHLAGQRVGVRRTIVVGCNDHGRQLAREMSANPMLGLDLAGYFDDRRAPGRAAEGERILGRLADVPDYVKRNDVQVIYLALPMASQPRILALLDALRDTTATIYFVPDIFVTDLIQARMDAVGRMPVVAVCDTPFAGINGLVKRASDVVLSLLILTLISPVLLAIAALVKASSPGPVIFKQRRYGLDGKEILVYKFRSMKVCEDGPQIAQARKDDDRVTPIGRILRKTSLDELPQFFNVLRGEMSIVGPRPHAVAHNEAYRKLIKGYMVRHKVKPGITGWAQIHGFRGETETLDKMQSRIDYDLEYLRHWSLRLDLYVIARTVLVVFKDSKAY